MNKWLESLQKTEDAERPPSKPAADPLLTAMFGATEDDVLIAPEKMDKVHDDGSADVPDPVAQFFEKNEKDKLRIPEFAAPHADGTVIEKSGTSTFHFHYKGGSLVKTEIFDNGGHEVIDETAKPVYITNGLAKLIGYGEENQHNDIGLAGYRPNLDAA